MLRVGVEDTGDPLFYAEAANRDRWLWRRALLQLDGERHQQAEDEAAARNGR